MTSIARMFGMECCQDQSRQEPKTKLTMADILRAGGAEYRREYGHTLTVEQDRALREIPGCRTPLFGGHVHICGGCGCETPSYNSCHNRSCPRCGGGKRARWHNNRLKEMLPVEYYHVVFTVPDEIAQLAAANPRIVYGILFRAVADGTAKTAREWTPLKAQLGFTAMLHSWGQVLNLHPHIHALIPCGGLSLETGRWVDMPPGFFLPKQRMADDFRDTFLALLQKSYDKDELKLVGKVRHLACPERFAKWMADLASITWITYASSLSDGDDVDSTEAMERTVGYLARYACRVAISNERLISLEDGVVSFYYKDYRDNRGRGPMKVQPLPIIKFIRRFLTHVMPNSMQSSRPVGYLANKYRAKSLAIIREQLGVADEDDVEPESAVDDEELLEEVESDDANLCAKCGKGRLAFSHHLRRPTVNEIYTARWQDLLAVDAVIEVADLSEEFASSGKLEFW
jgi:hypothetical protein